MIRDRGGPGIATMENLATSCGVLAGVGGAVHGMGEMAQGSVAPSGVVFDSWTTGPIAANLGGEPALSIVPNLLVTGLLTAVLSTAVAIWSAAFLDRPHAAGTLLVLVVGMLLVGGGFGPPVLGALAALVLRGSRASTAQDGRLTGDWGRRLAASWTTLFWVSVVNAAFLVLGSFGTAVLLDVTVPDAFVYSLFLAVVSLPLATLAGMADRRHPPRTRVDTAATSRGGT